MHMYIIITKQTKIKLITNPSRGSLTVAELFQSFAVAGHWAPGQPALASGPVYKYNASAHNHSSWFILSSLL